LLISDGGPDVILPQRLINGWTGYAGDDYEMACQIGDELAVGEMPNKPVWVLGGTAGSLCVGNVGGGIVILRIRVAPEQFRLPERMSDIQGGTAGLELISHETTEAVVMSAACMGDSITESDVVNIAYSRGSLLKSSELVTPAGGHYLVYQVSNASAEGADLRQWIYGRAISFEQKNGAF
jgi:hypothetical protein